MDFKDVSARFKKTRESAEQEVQPQKHYDPAESFRIRGKMIGVLEECARKLQVTPEQVERWELGDDTPSLPQLELLAYYLDVPVTHFWGTSTLEASEHDYSRVQMEYLALRDRMVGALLRQARESLELRANQRL